MTNERSLSFAKLRYATLLRSFAYGTLFAPRFARHSSCKHSGTYRLSVAKESKYLSEERSDEHKATYLIGHLSSTLHWILMTEGALRLSVAKEVGRPFNTHTFVQDLSCEALRSCEAAEQSVACEPRSEALSLRRAERGASRARGQSLVAAGFSWQKLSEAIGCPLVSRRVALQPMAKI